MSDDDEKAVMLTADDTDFHHPDNAVLRTPGMSDAPISPAMTIAALALNLAMKYHDFATIKDGTMYQQYKLEGRNLTPIDLETVLTTAQRLQLHLLTEERVIVDMMAGVLEDAIDSILEEGEEPPAAPADVP